MSSYSLPVNEQAEEEFHAPLDYREASNRRKTVAIFLLGIVVLVLIAVVVRLATAPREAYVVVKEPNGEEYVISSPQKKLDVRSDVLGYNAVKMCLMSFAEAYFERSSITAQKDYEHARWFLPDNLLAGYDATARGEKGWIKGLQAHVLPESHVQIDAIEMRDADLQAEPYSARVYLTRTNMADGQVTRSIATLVFVVRPDAWTDQKNTNQLRFSRFPLYNALGVFVVKPIQETPYWDGRK